MKKTLFQKVLYWVFFPVLVVTATIVTIFLTNSLILGGAAGLIVLFIYGIVRGVAYNSWQPWSKDQGRVVGYALALTWGSLLFKANPYTNPFGTTGWFCLSVTSIFFVVVYLSSLARRYVDWGLSYRRTYFYLFEGFFIFGIIAGIYLLWGTQYVWVPTATALIVSLSSSETLEDWSKSWKSDSGQSPQVLVVMAVACLVSTTIQFWESVSNFFEGAGDFFGKVFHSIGNFFSWSNIPIVFGIRLWVMVGIIVVSFIIGFSIRMFLISSRKRKNKKLIEAKRTRDLEDKRQREDQLAKKNEEEKRQRRVSAQDLLKRIQDESRQPKWEELLIALRSDLSVGGNIPYTMIADANIEDLFRVSAIKKQIVWTADSLDRALYAINQVCGHCFDDTVLEKMVKQIRVLEKYAGYDGYSTLRKLNKEWSGIWKIIQLKEADKVKEIV